MRERAAAGEGSRQVMAGRGRAPPDTEEKLLSLNLLVVCVTPLQKSAAIAKNSCALYDIGK